MKTTLRIQSTDSHEAAAEELVGVLGRAGSEAARVEADRLRFALACYRSQLRTTDAPERLECVRRQVAESVLAHHVNRARKVAHEPAPDDERTEAAA